MSTYIKSDKHFWVIYFSLDYSPPQMYSFELDAHAEKEFLGEKMWFSNLSGRHSTSYFYYSGFVILN